MSELKKISSSSIVIFLRWPNLKRAESFVIWLYLLGCSTKYWISCYCCGTSKILPVWSKMEPCALDLHVSTVRFPFLLTYKNQKTGDWKGPQRHKKRGYTQDKENPSWLSFLKSMVTLQCAWLGQDFTHGLYTPSRNWTLMPWCLACLLIAEG